MQRRHTAFLVMVLAAIPLMGCNNLFHSFVPTIKPTVTLNSSISGSQIDAGQSITVQAFAVSDSGAGVTWTLANGSPGTLTNVSVTQVTYTAPSPLTASAQVTITATAKSDSTVSASLTFTVEPAPVIAGSLSAGSVGTAYSGSLTVTGGVGPFFWNVTGLPNGVTWAASASPGSALNFSGTPANEGTSTVTVTLVDSAQPQVAAPADNLTLTINPATLVITPTTLNSLMVLAFFNQALTAAPGASAPLTWTVSSGSLPSGVSLNSTTGVLSGTPTATGPYSFAVKVSDAETPTAGTGTATFSGTVEASTVASTLSGQYAFLLQGFDSNGAPAAIVGSFATDGNGGVTGGSLDVNDNFAAGQSTAALAGNYTIDGNLRGSITFGTSVTQVAKPISLAYTLSADGTRGKLVSLDLNQFQMSGEMVKQDSAEFTATSLQASFAFGLESRTTPRACVAGQFAIGSNAQLTGLLDEIEAGTGSQASLPVTGMENLAPDSNGRGTIVLTANQVSKTFSYYVASAQELYLIETDPQARSTSILAGRAFKQKLPFTAATVNAGSVFALTGFDGNAASFGSTAAVGRFVVQNSSNAQFSFDENAATGGTIKTANLGGTTTFDATTGRGSLTITGGFSGGLFDQGVFYAYDSGAGFLIEGTPGATARAMLGRFMAQSAGAGFATPSGNLIAMYGESASQPLTESDAFQAISNGQANGVADVRTQGLPDQVDQPSSGGTFSAPDSTGRGTAMLPGPLFGLNAGTNVTSVYYLVAANQFVLINTVANKASAIAWFDPQ